MNLALNDIVDLTLYCSISNQASINRFFWQVTAVGGTPATVQDAANELDAFYAPLYKAILANTALYNGVTAQVVFPLPIMVRAIADANSGFGTAGLDVCPKQVAPLVAYYTALAGPGFRGRTYLPFPATADITTLGEMAAGYRTNANVIAASRAADFAISVGGRTATLKPGLWRRSGNIFTPIILAFTRGKVATQKRRGDYGRANSSPV